MHPTSIHICPMYIVECSMSSNALSSSLSSIPQHSAFTSTTPSTAPPISGQPRVTFTALHKLVPLSRCYWQPHPSSQSPAAASLHHSAPAASISVPSRWVLTAPLLSVPLRWVLVAPPLSPLQVGVRRSPPPSVPHPLSPMQVSSSRRRRPPALPLSPVQFSSSRRPPLSPMPSPHLSVPC